MPFHDGEFMRLAEQGVGPRTLDHTRRLIEGVGRAIERCNIENILDGYLITTERIQDFQAAASGLDNSEIQEIGEELKQELRNHVVEGIKACHFNKE